jgi:hypothetical protein
MYNARIRLVTVGILAVILKQLDNGKSKDKDVVQDMTTQLRVGIEQSKPEVSLSDAVECDEVYVTVVHKGKPEQVKKKVAKEGVIGSRGFGGGVMASFFTCLPIWVPTALT